MEINSVQLAQLTKIKDFAKSFSNLEDDYLISRIQFDTSQQHEPKASQPVRINGFTLLLCLDGQFSLDINIDNYVIEPRTVMMVGPNNILRFNKLLQENIDAYMMFISTDFIKDINLDINTINPHRLPQQRTPIKQLSEDEARHMRRYLDLIYHNTANNTDPVCVRNIARCLMASLIYQMMQYALNSKTIENRPNEDESQPQSRRMNYVRNFMALVQEHHCKERTVGFYADKLFISPKYLSLIIKEATGRSAAEWIDEYVILEAKNLLRFSGKNIQQVAYELNFTNQSSFGKYFKHLTGMSPSEFQRS